MFLAFVMSADDSDAYQVWLGEPARKHGVIDADIWHAVRTAMRRVVVDEDLMMLNGRGRPN